MSESPFITFDELYTILRLKYNANMDEVIYWVETDRSVSKPYGSHRKIFLPNDGSFILPYESDLPNCNDMYVHSMTSPEYSFYYHHIANLYIPRTHHRFVYLRDLSGKRNWSAHPRSDTNLYSDFPSLDRACREGMVRFYDENKKQFTLKKDQASPQLWIDTRDGQDYLSNPNSPFLLEDIIKIERIFFNRPREDCLKELGIEE